MHVKRLGFFYLAFAVVAVTASAQNVKITPLGSHTAEFCATDRALIFEDPTGVRILYDAGQSVAGATDARLGEVHVVLLSHAHGDHIGDMRLAKVGAGSCAKPETVSAAPNSNTAEIAAAKNSAVVASNDMSLFLGKKIENIRGTPIGNCATSALSRETTVPQSAPCRANLQLGGKRTLKFSGAAEGVGISLVQAVHSNNVPRSLLSEPSKANLAADALTGYVGHANGYVLEFTNGLKVYLTGDTALMGDMKTIINGYYRVNLAVINMGAFAMQPHQAAYAVNELIQPNAVIPSHANEAATAGGKIRPGSRTQQFADLIRGRPVHLPLSGKTMEFDGNGRCVAGC